MPRTRPSMRDTFSPSGEVIAKSCTRSTGNMAIRKCRSNLEDVRLADTTVAVTLTSTNGVPVVAERSMFLPGPPPAAWDEAAESAGVPARARKWGLAEGEVGGNSGHGDEHSPGQYLADHRVGQRHPALRGWNNRGEECSVSARRAASRSIIRHTNSLLPERSGLERL